MTEKTSVYPTLPESTTAPPPYVAQQNYPQQINSMQPMSSYPPPPPPGYPIIGTQMLLSQHPTRIRCPNCSAEIITNVSFKTGCLTWAICGGLCAAGLACPLVWLGCQFIPFCVNDCKDAVHTCPNCKNYIGTYDRMK